MWPYPWCPVPTENSRSQNLQGLQTPYHRRRLAVFSWSPRKVIWYTVLCWCMKTELLYLGDKHGLSKQRMMWLPPYNSDSVGDQLRSDLSIVNKNSTTKDDCLTIITQDTHHFFAFLLPPYHCKCHNDSNILLQSVTGNNHPTIPPLSQQQY